MTERMFAIDGASNFHGTLPSILVVPSTSLLLSGDHATAFHAVKALVTGAATPSFRHTFIASGIVRYRTPLPGEFTFAR
jgi:hypothetical protein